MEQGEAVRPIYLDHNATTPVALPVLEAMLPYLESEFGNPSSSHQYGERSHRAVERGRTQVAAALGCPAAADSARSIVFTGGGSESDNLAITGVALAHALEPGGRRRRHIVTTAIEHPAVLSTCFYLERRFGFGVKVVPVDGTGLVDPDDVRQAIEPGTVLVSVMHANNEVGTLQPIPEIALVAREAGVVFHCDAAQSVGKVPTDVGELGVDLLTVAGHKLGAPKGVGALYVRPGTRLDPVIHGASHEGGLRAGTENVPYIVALGTAAQLATGRVRRGASADVLRLRDRLHSTLQSEIPGLALNGHPTRRLPNTLNVSFPGVDGTELLARTPAVAASTGSACHEGRTEPSGVLTAMGIRGDRALGAVRLSLGHATTESEVDEAAAALVKSAVALGVRA
jgi:cysteine desulfurase